RPRRSLDELGGAVRARHDHPVVALDIDGIVGRLDLDQRALDDPVALFHETPDERACLRARAGDDDFHAANAMSSEARAAGSSPVRRPTPPPSGAATSAVNVSPSRLRAHRAGAPT